MRLLDQVAQAEGPLLVRAPDGRIFSLPGAAALSATLRETPLRYVLDDGVAAFASSLAFPGAVKLTDFLDLARFPVERLWVEWDDAARAPALHSAGAVEASLASRRAGVLISCDAGGRKGVMRALWANCNHPPDLSPVITKFDLDDAEFASHTERAAWPSPPTPPIPTVWARCFATPASRSTRRGANITPIWA